MVGPAFVWLAIQLGALTLSAARVPFSATKRFPQPGELLALWVMLFVQVTFSALLFPLLMRTFTTGVMTVVSALPFTIVAGFLAGDWDRIQMAAMCGYLTAWLVGLGLWRSVLRSPRAQGTGVALALLARWRGRWRGTCGVSSGWGRTVAWGEVSVWGPYFGAMHLATIRQIRASAVGADGCLPHRCGGGGSDWCPGSSRQTEVENERRSSHEVRRRASSPATRAFPGRNGGGAARNRAFSGNGQPLPTTPASLSKGASHDAVIERRRVRVALSTAYPHPQPRPSHPSPFSCTKSGPIGQGNPEPLRKTP